MRRLDGAGPVRRIAGAYGDVERVRRFREWV